MQEFEFAVVYFDEERSLENAFESSTTRGEGKNLIVTTACSYDDAFNQAIRIAQAHGSVRAIGLWTGATNTARRPI